MELLRRKVRQVKPSIEVTRFGSGLIKLCRKAEPKLRDSIRRNEVILVNDTFLVKPNNGVFAGVGVAETLVADGKRVHPTKWYIPDGGWSVKSKIVHAYFNNEPTVTIPETTRWIEIRRIRPFTLSRRKIRKVVARLANEGRKRAGT